MSQFNLNSRSFQFSLSTLGWLAFVLLVSSLASAVSAQQVDVWIGTSGAEGIFHLKLNTENGKLSQPRNVSKIANAGFLALHLSLIHI